MGENYNTVDYNEHTSMTKQAKIRLPTQLQRLQQYIQMVAI